MPNLINVNNLTKEFNADILFKDISFSCNEKSRLAIIGDNGVGKTTLLKILLGIDEDYKGSFSFYKGIKIGYLHQNVISDEKHTLYEELEEVFVKEKKLIKEIDEISDKLINNYSDDLLINLNKLQDELEKNNGYNYEYKIKQVLNSFFFNKEDYEREISSFSGGEKERISFAKLLLLNPDILFLDEPTNHLDIVTIEWLENYLSNYEGCIVFISHDVSFIKKISNCILEIEDKKAEFYNMNYDNYVKTKKDRYESLLIQYKFQELERKKLERFIEFYMPKPRFASRAHDREKKLARLNANAIEDPTKKTKNIKFNLSSINQTNRKLLDVDKLSIGYNNSLVDNISFTLYNLDHLAIIGANGTGKTTFIKTLQGEIKPLNGDIKKYHECKIGYLSQILPRYDKETTLFEELRNCFPKIPNQEIYSKLARYSFSYEESNSKKVSLLSGGELMRFSILKISFEQNDILILDEPTNHLDLKTISELEKTLSNYDGAIIIVSHNRSFIDQVCNKILYFYQKTPYYYEGDYSSFNNEIISKITNINTMEADNTKYSNGSKTAEKKNHRINQDKLILKIDMLETKLKTLEEECLKEENYSSNTKMNELDKDIKNIKEQIKELYSQLE